VESDGNDGRGGGHADLRRLLLALGLAALARRRHLAA
jgi:hypothetical protein